MNEIAGMGASDEWNQFYPEIESAGSLRAALAKALLELGSPLILKDSIGLNPKAYARVEFGHRCSQVYVAAHERRFLPDFWSNGVCLAGGNCPDLQQTAAGLHFWVTDARSRVSQLSRAFPWVIANEGAEAFEEGREVEWKWKKMIEREDREERASGFLELVKRASAEPRLRMLFPYTSLTTLCFSRCTGYPYTDDTPSITPFGDGTFRVSGIDGKAVGRGVAEVAVRLAADILPPGCGAARPGTAEDCD